MFWNNYVKMCERVGKTPNAVAAELGLSSGSVTAWKRGRLPRGGTIEIIAKYFGVESTELLGGRTETAPTTAAEPQDPLVSEITSLSQLLSRTETGLARLKSFEADMRRAAELEQLAAELEAAKKQKPQE